MKALVLNTFGGPEVLEYCEVMDPVIGPDEILVRMKAIGLNFAELTKKERKLSSCRGTSIYFRL